MEAEYVVGSLGLMENLISYFGG